METRAIALPQLTNTFVAIFNKIPMPPSVNQAYVNAGRRRVSTQKLRNFKREMDYWALENRKDITLAIKAISKAKRPLIGISFELAFPRSKILKVDASNRIKGVEDAICKLLGIDDRYVFRVSAEKAVATSEYVTATIYT